MNNKPDLQFLQSTDKVGFTSAAVGNVSRAGDFSAIVRELIQNSLDASRAAKNEKAIIRFRISTIETDEIPGITSYRRALKQAKIFRMEENDGELTHQEQRIVTRMENALTESELPVLAVIDNGVGLTPKTMRALLSDGISAKQGESGGAFGNGHFAVFPISDLRYLLYAAVNGSGWIASGHTILASQPGCSANGYYISGANGNGEHRYPTGRKVELAGKQVPGFIRRMLAEIEEKYAHGTVVLVPAFNNFYKSGKTKIYEPIAEAAVCSFFPAIEQGKLTVIWEKEDGREEKLDARGLQKILNLFEEKKQNKNFLSGYKANRAYEAMKEGTHKSIAVGDGKIDIYLKTPSSDGRSRVNLFRNGMWITNNDRASGGLPGFYNKFGNYLPFEAVVLVTAEGAPEFHELIRCSETPLHNQLEIGSMKSIETERIKELFNELLDWFKGHLQEISTEPYRSDLLPVTARGVRPSNLTGLYYDGDITLMPTRYPRQNQAHPGEEDDVHPENYEEPRTSHIKRRKLSKKEIKVLPDAFSIVARPAGDDGKKIYIHSHTQCDDLILRLAVDENTDSTTDTGLWKQLDVDILSAVKDSGQALEIVNNPSSGVRIGSLGAGEGVTLFVTYKISGIAKSPISSPSFRLSLESFGSDSGGD